MEKTIALKMMARHFYQDALRSNYKCLKRMFRNSIKRKQCIFPKSSLPPSLEQSPIANNVHEKIDTKFHLCGFVQCDWLPTSTAV